MQSPLHHVSRRAFRIPESEHPLGRDVKDGGNVRGTNLFTRIFSGVVLETLKRPNTIAQALKTHANIHVLEVEERDVFGNCDHLLRDDRTPTVGKAIAVRGVLVLRVEVGGNEPER